MLCNTKKRFRGWLLNFVDLLREPSVDMALRILHTADWHLGQNFYEYDRAPEHERFLAWLRDTLVEKRADVLLISGDIFDVSNPPASAQRMFYTFLKEATSLLPGLQVVCIAGNHDSAARLESPRALLEAFRVTVTGMIPRTSDGYPDYPSLMVPLRGRSGGTEAWCLAVPFLRQGDFPGVTQEGDRSYAEGITTFYREALVCAASMRQPGEALIVTGHLHTMEARTSEEDKSERPIMGGLELVPAGAFGTEAQYVALGHIHRPQTVAGCKTIRYAGSPLPMSFSEQHYRHQVVCVDLEEGNVVKVDPLPIPVTVPLLSVPSQPRPLSEVLPELEQLPSGHENRQEAPYLRVRILLEGPEPSLRYQIEKALENKTVRLARIEVTYPEREDDGTGSSSLSTASGLDTLQPLDIFRKKYTARFREEIPEALVTLFQEVVAGLPSGEEAEELTDSFS